MYRIVYTKQAAKDITSLKSAGLEIKAKELIEVIRGDPFQKPPAYEPLVGNLKGFFSRRINIQHRLVYQVYAGEFEEDNIKYEGTVKIVRMWSHYDKI
ncbi:MAG: Txe/YoeB family addiction module toxin [Blautia sp.]|nr:Txe/YoeB family addiction module toxin [Blautia sp.]